MEEDEERFGSPNCSKHSQYTRHDGDLQAPNVRKNPETAPTPCSAVETASHPVYQYNHASVIIALSSISLGESFSGQPKLDTYTNDGHSGGLDNFNPKT